MDYKFINTGYLDAVAGEDNNILSEIIDIFKEQMPQMLQEMKELFAEKDYYSLGLLAHKAKSSIAIMGMDDLAALLKTFEIEAKEGEHTEKYEYYINRFEKDTAEAILELDDLISNRLKQK
ncbi:MAG TPA: Hpt domain-containing protein [Bacteroidales bacterium]|jgi:HPt (histidine-containing phosphotransfer) domain-containing protein|nr:Hpt domain-containing protein [Bacteroidales bacterium]